MKITWFSKSSFRIHIGGQIVVVDSDAAPNGIDRNELVSGADVVVDFLDTHAEADAASWSPRARQRLLDSGDTIRPAQLWTVGAGSLLIDADDDMPLLILSGPLPPLGRWVERSVIVLAGQGLAERTAALVSDARPRLIALAGSENEVGEAFGAVRAHLDGTGLVAIEPGMAVEV